MARHGAKMLTPFFLCLFWWHSCCHVIANTMRHTFVFSCGFYLFCFVSYIEVHISFRAQRLISFKYLKQTQKIEVQKIRIQKLGNSDSNLQQHPPLSWLVSIKLDDDNFLTYKEQSILALKSAKLFKNVDEVTQDGKPKQFLIDVDKENNNNNENFDTWEQQDQIVLTWLLVSCLPFCIPKNGQVWSCFSDLEKLVSVFYLSNSSQD